MGSFRRKVASAGRWATPPGIILDEGDSLSVSELMLEWLAYLYESRFDRLLLAILIACLYDLLWTPCLFLLPINVKLSYICGGFVIDGLWATSILASFFVWGCGNFACTLVLDLTVCLPWELIGYGTSDRMPLMWLRAIVKVFAFVVHFAPDID